MDRYWPERALFWKMGTKYQIFTTPPPLPYLIPFLNVLHQNKALQNLTVKCNIVLEYALANQPYTDDCSITVANCREVFSENYLQQADKTWQEMKKTVSLQDSVAYPFNFEKKKTFTNWLLWCNSLTFRTFRHDAAVGLQVRDIDIVFI